ncbi:hypothetical protein E4T66_18025 [Sinimarinibacterium sp. CAU 1509]|uniref:hypothetical protein n=1 Tax=Sinimarinibacterium sp. CAU 1509 TaxID=2562283 RepID=UPI0010AD512D|nr:hypothetical protein [Sinimarinibacterium sp. CAU 1509]TJY57304.1 hypothetical protein E4T66_18025 [Sinimarinibacterium sp. CAU 1509]
MSRVSGWVSAAAVALTLFLAGCDSGPTNEKVVLDLADRYCRSADPLCEYLQPEYEVVGRKTLAEDRRSFQFRATWTRTAVPLPMMMAVRAQVHLRANANNPSGATETMRLLLSPSGTQIAEEGSAEFVKRGGDWILAE